MSESSRDLRWLAPATHGVGDSGGGGVNVLVFPHSDHEPSSVDEALGGIEVSLAVAFDLGGPVPAIDFVPAPAMIRAPMPEAPIHEHRNTDWAEDDVCSPAEGGHGAAVDAVPKAHPVELAPKRKLRHRVLVLLGAHAALDSVGGGERLTPGLRHGPEGYWGIAHPDAMADMVTAVGSAEVSEALDHLVRGLIGGTLEPEPDAPAEVRPWLDDLLSKVDTYRDAALMVLAFAVDAGSSANVATPPTGRRTVAQRLASLFDELNYKSSPRRISDLGQGDELVARAPT